MKKYKKYKNTNKTLCRKGEYIVGREVSTLAVDLDGVIFRISLAQFYREGMDYFGTLIPYAKTALKKLREDGWRVVIYTCRLNPKVNPGFTITELREKVENILNKNNIPYDEVYSGVGKPLADHYIDDRAIRFESWKQILSILEEK